ncbi:MAG: hypothetical protein ABI232_01395 [Jatrophihabitantaceae bacterium]
MAVVLGLLALLALDSVPATAAPGTWGAGQYTYLDGVVCDQADGSTAPLASWDFGTGAPAFLTEMVTSNGLQDSAALPVPSAGAQYTNAVAPGQDGFTSAADIATYAKLIAKYGASDTARVVDVAAALQLKATGATADCATNPAALIGAAADGAGPYTVRLTTTVPAVLGKVDTLVATVRGGTGRPVAGLTVGFAGVDTPVSNASAVTAADGTAKTQFTVPAGISTSKFSFSASVSAVIGLDEVTVAVSPSFTNPSGTAATAVTLAAPVTTSAMTTVSVDPTASPVLQPSASVRGVALGVPFTPGATVTGMRGHSGQATLTIYGPVPLDTAAYCTAASFGASTPVAASTNAIPVAGDQTIVGLPWTPEKAGCYYVGASIATTDATPNVTVNSGFGIQTAKVTVVPTTLALTVANPIAGLGALAASVAPAHVGTAKGVISARLLGPLPPPTDGTCSALTWTKAPHSTAVATAQLNGVKAVTITSTPVTKGGCYEWAPQLQFDVPGAGTVTVPATSSAAAVLVLTPSVTMTSDQIWAATPNPVSAHVTVFGTYGQAAHVVIAMRYVPTPAQGCSFADFRHAATVAAGPSFAVAAAGEVVVAQTGPTTQPGCYSPVPTLTVDNFPTITATGKVGVASNTIGAGVPLSADGPQIGNVPQSGIGTRALITLIVIVLLELALVGALGYWVYLNRGAGAAPNTSIASVLGAPRPSMLK